MANKKRYNFYCETELWQELGENLEDGNRSRFLRDAIINYLEKGDDLTELKKLLKEKEHQQELLNIEIKDIKKQIVELEQIQEDNINNEVFIIELIDEIKAIAESENGITEKRIKFIAKNKVDANILIGKVRQKGIKIINEAEKQTDKKGNVINVKPYEPKEKNINPYTSIVKAFNRKYNTDKGKYNNSKLKYYNAHKDRYKKMVEKKQLNIKEFEKIIFHEEPEKPN